MGPAKAVGQFSTNQRMFSTMVLTVLRFTAGVGTAHAVKTNPRRKEEEKWDNGNVHRAAAKDIQAEKAARPAAPCATYCYHAN